MAWTTLKNTIAEVIDSNGINAIGGGALGIELDRLIDEIGGLPSFAGVATTATTPIVTDGRAFYIASEAGTYSNFDGLVLYGGEVAVFVYDAGWSGEKIDLSNMNPASSLNTLFLHSGGGDPTISFDPNTRILSWSEDLIFGSKNKAVYRTRIGAGSVTFAAGSNPEMLYIDTRYVPVGSGGVLTFDITSATSPLKVGAYYDTGVPNRFLFESKLYQIPLFFTNGTKYFTYPPLPVLMSSGLAQYYSKVESDAKYETITNTDLISSNLDLVAFDEIKQYNPDYVFSGFVGTATSTPAHTANNCYIATVGGVVFGITVTQGQLIVDNGTTFFAVNKGMLSIVDSIKTLTMFAGSAPTFAFDDDTNTLSWSDQLIINVRGKSQPRLKIAAGSVTFGNSVSEILFLDLSALLGVDITNELSFDISLSSSVLKVGTYYDTALPNRFTYQSKGYHVPLFSFIDDGTDVKYYSLPPLPPLVSSNISNLYSKPVIDDKKAMRSVLDEIITSTSLTKYYDALSNTFFDQEYSISATGDYVEFEIRLDGDITTNYNALGILGKESAVNNFTGWLSATEFRLRGDDGAWVIFSGLSAYSTLGDIVKVKLLSNLGNWELYFNDALVGTEVKTGNLLIDRIANTYGFNNSVSLFSMRNLVISSVSGSISIGQIWKSRLQHDNITVAADTDKGIIIGDTGGGAVYENVYVDYSATGGASGAGLFKVYVKSKEDAGKYILYNIDHDLDAGIRVDIWRLKEVSVHNIVDDFVFGTKLGTILSNGENEFTYKHVGATDFTGGFHGDQELTDVMFFLDGIETSFASDFQASCSEFSYIMKSETLETDNIARVVEGGNIKHTKIGYLDGLSILIRQTWAAAVTIDLCYNSILSVFFDASDYYTNETYEVVDTTDGIINIDVLVGNERNFRAWNADTNLSFESKSDFKTEIVGANSKVKSAVGAYNKLYISYVPTNYVTTIGEVFESVTDVKFAVGN